MLKYVINIINIKDRFAGPQIYCITILNKKLYSVPYVTFSPNDI